MGTQQAKKQYPTGTRPHGNGIQIKFKPKGYETDCYETLPWSPTPANLAKAGRLRQDIKDAIKHDVFRYGDFFPDSPKSQLKTPGTFAHYCQEWLDRPDHNWKGQSRDKFKGILSRVWMPELYDKPICSITLSTLNRALSSAIVAYKEKQKIEPKKDPSQSLYNDWLLCLRGVFDTAVRDEAISRTTNPAAELKNKKRPKTEPDPFDDEEREAIIADIYKNDGTEWGAWFELGFFTGLRYPSEPSALQWPKISLRKNEMRIDQILVKRVVQTSTKTSVTRTSSLNSRAQSALKKMRKITGFSDGFIFVLPNGNPIGENKRMYAIWKASLKRLGIRYRDIYNMRHSFASWGLTNGLNPAYLAGQMGHSLEEFFKTYAKWIAGAHNALQIELMERAISQNVAETWQEQEDIS